MLSIEDLTEVGSLVGKVLASDETNGSSSGPPSLSEIREVDYDDLSSESNNGGGVGGSGGRIGGGQQLIDVDATASFDVVSDMHQFETLKRERRELEQRVRALEGAAAEAQTRESALQAEKAALQQSEASLRAAQASLRSEGVAQGQRIARLEAESADAAEQAKGLRAALEEAATQQAAALTETAQLTETSATVAEDFGRRLTALKAQLKDEKARADAADRRAERAAALADESSAAASVAETRAEVAEAARRESEAEAAAAGRRLCELQRHVAAAGEVAAAAAAAAAAEADGLKSRAGKAEALAAGLKCELAKVKARNATGAKQFEEQRAALEAAEMQYQELLEQVASAPPTPPRSGAGSGSGGGGASVSASTVMVSPGSAGSASSSFGSEQPHSSCEHAAELVALKSASDEAARVLKQFPPTDLSIYGAAGFDEDEEEEADGGGGGGFGIAEEQQGQLSTCAAAAAALRRVSQALASAHGSKICIERFGVGEVAMFFPVPRKSPSDPQEYVAFSDQRNATKHFLADDSKALIGKSRHFKDAYVLGRIVHKDKSVVDGDTARRLCLRPGAEYFSVTVAALPFHN